MSVEMKVIEFEQREAHLTSELDGGPPYTVHGVALGDNDITRGASGVKKLWPADELREAAETLQGTNLVVDHNNDASGVVGNVTKAGYQEGVGVIYEAELYDEDLAEKIANGLLEVSVRGYHIDVDEMELDEETDAKIVEDIKFDNLSIVPSGASPSNTLEMGSHEELTAAELSAYVDTLDYEAMLQEDVEPGMWVDWGDGKGITISQPEDGEIEVDVYAEKDGKWRSTGETEMVSVDAISEWDVDEEEDIGAIEDDEESEDEESDEEEASKHKMDPETEDDKESESEGHDFQDGMMVQWQANPDMFGQVVHVDDQDEMKVMVEVMEMQDGEMVSTGHTVSAGFSDLVPMDDSGGMPENTSPSMEEMSAVATLERFSDYPEAASENAQMALDAREETDNPNDCGTDVGWKRANQLANGEGLTREQVGKMSAFNRHRSNSEQSDEEGRADCGWMMWKAWGGDEGVDWAQKKLESIEEENAKHKMDPEEEDDKEMEGSEHGVPPDHRFESEEEAEAMAEEMGIEGAHEIEFDGETMWVPGESHEMYADAIEEMGRYDRGEGAEDSGPQNKFNQPERYPDVDGDEDDDEPERSGTFEENEEAELQEYEMHTPEWSGTTTAEWSSPDMEDFDTDDLETIGAHFLISATGFPAENFTDLKLPVVEPSGDLNVNALAAVKGGRGVSAVDGLSDDMEERITEWVNETANKEFDKDWGMDEEENAVTARDAPSDESVPTHKMDPSVEDDKEMEAMDPVSTSLDFINLYLRTNGRDERDSVDKMLGWLFSSTDIPGEKIEAFRTAANAFLDQQGGSDSFDAVDVESFRDWLLTQGGQTDDGTYAKPTTGGGLPRIATPVHVLSGDDLRSVYAVGASKKDNSNTEDTTNMTDIEEELAELNEPVAVEKSDFESLQEKADRFDEMSENLEALRERTDVLDSVNREQVEELADSDDPMILETAEYEALSAEAEQVKQVYAEALSGEGPFSAEDLVDKFSIEELREKYEEAGHEIEEELNPAPKGSDPSEEELEQKAEEENKSEEELAQEDAIADKQAELREKILGN